MRWTFMQPHRAHTRSNLKRVSARADANQKGPTPRLPMPISLRATIWRLGGPFPATQNLGTRILSAKRCYFSIRALDLSCAIPCEAIRKAAGLNSLEKSCVAISQVRLPHTEKLRQVKATFGEDSRQHGGKPLPTRMIDVRTSAMLVAWDAQIPVLRGHPRKHRQRAEMRPTGSEKK
jgi:hypothetical protein